MSGVTQILADDHGHLWFGSAGGVFRVNRGELLDCVPGVIVACDHRSLIGIQERR